MQMKRSERFQRDYLEHIENLIQTISPHIQLKYKDLPEETRHANLAVAEFVKVILKRSIWALQKYKFGLRCVKHVLKINLKLQFSQTKYCSQSQENV